MKFKSLIIFIFILTATLNSKDKKIGLVLSGGAAKGFAHIGVLKVLEDEGIVPDYIAGTSMGAIIGGLYALGYSAYEIEDIILNQDWKEIFNDKITRDQMNILDKESLDRYFFTLPINELQINLPEGLVRGQKIYNLLINYSLPAYNIDDFSKLPIPFICIGTDIQTGESIIMDSGYLPEALRASMAIPTLFTPGKYKDKLIVDGGLVNNFPVIEAKDMGADYIIGSDVQDPLLDKNKLNTIGNILYQSIKFLRLPKYKESIEACNLYISPNVVDFKAQEFSKAKELILEGEKAARKHIEQIRKIKNDFNIREKPKKPDPIEKIKITDIEFSGLKTLSYNYVVSMLGLNIGEKYDVNEIEKYLNQTFASGFFELVYYKLEKYKDGFKIKINAVEKPYDELKIGINYNTDFNAAIMFQLKFNNLLYQGTKLSLESALGDNPRAEIDYSLFTSWKSRYYLRSELNNFDLFTYDGQNVSSSFELTNLIIELGAERQIIEDLSFGGSGMFEFASLGDIVAPLKLTNYDNTYMSIRTYLNMDKMNRIYFPKSGVMWNLEFRKIWDLSDTENPDYTLFNAEQIYGRYTQAISFNKKLTFIPSFFGGLTFGEKEIPLTYRYYLGGLSSLYIKGIYPFVGMNFLQKNGDKVWVGRLDIQYELIDDVFVTLKNNIGETFLDFDELYDQLGFNWGIATSFGYASIVGPIELNFMWGTEISGMITYFRIGVGI